MGYFGKGCFYFATDVYRGERAARMVGRGGIELGKALVASTDFFELNYVKKYHNIALQPTLLVTIPLPVVPILARSNRSKVAC